MTILNKMVCMICMAETRPVDGRVVRETGEKVLADVPVVWSRFDREQWRVGKVLCPSSLGPRFFNVAFEKCNRQACHRAVTEGALLVRDEVIL
jgi:hypothetical protein